MLTEDYFMRMINQALVVLRRILRMKEIGSYQEALAEIDRMLEMLLGLRADLIKQLDDESILAAVSQGEQLDTDRLYVVAELINEEGGILAATNRRAEAAVSYVRALNFYIETVLSGGAPGFEPPGKKIEVLLSNLKGVKLSPDTLYPLFCYYEETGSYAKGEKALSQLAVDPELQAEIHKEQAAYYQRLLQKPDGELQKGGLERSEIEARLRGLDR
jgi:hypothetical protein